MALEQEVYDVSLKASADLSAYQFMGVKISADKTCAPATAAACDGILQNKPAAAGRAAQVRRMGISKAVAGAAIAVNAPVTADAAAKLVTATSGQRYVGIALEAATAANQTITVLMEMGNKV